MRPPDVLLSLALGALAITAAPGCGGDESRAADPRGATSSGSGGDGGCAAGGWLVDGDCQAAGVPPEACGAGFEPDASMGCQAVLPADPCAPGQMAVPGETACRPIGDCGVAPWGKIPVGDLTQYVDASYPGTDSDGTAARPWTTIQAAIDAAAQDAVVAIASGSYQEDVKLAKRVQLWGRCPSLVEVSGAGVKNEVVLVGVADGIEIHGLALTGSNLGVAISGVEAVVLDGLWVHDNARAGVEIVDAVGATSATLRGSLVEANGGVGVHTGGATVAVERSVVRDTQIVTGDPFSGSGIDADQGPTTAAPSNLTVRGSLLERNHDASIYVTGSTAVIEDTEVRDTGPGPGDRFGRALGVEDHPTGGRPSTVEVRRSVFERSLEGGIFIGASQVIIEDTVVRDVTGQISDGSYGDGVSAANDYQTGARAGLTLRRSLVERVRAVGVQLVGTDATMEGVLIREVGPEPADQLFGFGIALQDDPNAMQATDGTVRGCVVEKVSDAGIAVYGSTAALQSVLVRDVIAQAADGLFGDGIAAVPGFVGAAHLELDHVRIENASRAALTSFDAPVAVGATRMECSPIDIDGEGAFAFEDRGGNVCGCGDAVHACAVKSSMLVPPGPATPH